MKAVYATFSGESHSRERLLLYEGRGTAVCESQSRGPQSEPSVTVTSLRSSRLDRFYIKIEPSHWIHREKLPIVAFEPRRPSVPLPPARVIFFRKLPLHIGIGGGPHTSVPPNPFPYGDRTTERAAFRESSRRPSRRVIIGDQSPVESA